MPSARMVGLISDTHGLLRPEAVVALQGCDLIIHAGDVGKSHILDELGAIAPVTAVRGNVDRGPWADVLPNTAIVEANSTLIYVLHDLSEFRIDAATPRIDIVVSGHTHKSASTERGGVMYINPGSAGPRRFRLPITVARLDLQQKPWRVDFINLSAG